MMVWRRGEKKAPSGNCAAKEPILTVSILQTRKLRLRVCDLSKSRSQKEAEAGLEHEFFFTPRLVLITLPENVWMLLSRVIAGSPDPSPQMSFFFIAKLSTSFVLKGTTCSDHIFWNLSLCRSSPLSLVIFITKWELHSHQNHLPIDPSKNVWQRRN